MPRPGYIPALRVPPAETQVDGLPPALSLDSDLNVPFAQRWYLRAKLERCGPLELVFYDSYDHQLSNAVPRSPFYTLLGVESMERLNFEHAQHLKIS